MRRQLAGCGRVVSKKFDPIIHTKIELTQPEFVARTDAEGTRSKAKFRSALRWEKKLPVTFG